MARLILRYPNNVIKEVDFDQSRLRIGTAQDNDVVVEHEDVEEHQAEIEIRDGAFSLKDLSGNNSTTVNGKTFETISITYGDRIAFGPVVGLFYPPQKSKMGERSKLLLFMAAGGGVLIVAIALIFFFISRPDYTDVVSGAALVEGDEESVSTERQRLPEEVQQRRDELAEAGEQEPRTAETTDQPEQGRGLALFSFFGGRGEDLLLPEPSEEDIEARTAVAIPRGLGRLFFRKRPIPGTRQDAPDTAAAAVEEGLEEVSVEAPEDAALPLETIPEGEDLPGFETEYTDQRERGVDAEGASRLLAPFRRIGALFRGEAGTEDIAELPISPLDIETVETVSEGVVEPAETVQESTPEEVRIEAESVQEITTEPEEETVIKARSRARSFEETPVYSPDELEQAETGVADAAVSLSDLDSENSRVLWSYSLENELASPVVVRSGMIGHIGGDRYRDMVIGTTGGELVALDGQRGTELFREDLGAPFFEPLLQDMNGDGRNDILVVFEHGEITVFDYADTLQVLWNYDGKVPFAASPALTDVNDDKNGDIVVANQDMEIIALDGSTGFEIWRFFDAETEISHAPVAVELNDDGIEDIIFSTRRGFLYAVDGSNGWGLWKGSMTGRLAGTPALGDLDGDGEVDIVTLTRDGTLSAYSRLGRQLFTEEMQGSFSTAPTVADSDGDGTEEILFIDNDGKIRAVRGATREELWQITSTAGPVDGRIVVNNLDDDSALEVLLTALSGVLFVLHGETGSRKAVFNSNDRLWTTPLVDDLRGHSLFRRAHKSILLCTESGRIYAIEIQDAEGRFFALKQTSWISTNHDTRNTGYVHSGVSILPWK